MLAIERQGIERLLSAFPGSMSYELPGGGEKMAEVHDHTEWVSFICTVCAERALVGRPPGLTDGEFARMLLFMYDDHGSPVCTTCQLDEREH
jgi:hypothetical protein